MSGDAANSHASTGKDRGFLEAALTQLRLKLLDLTGRNRLLNFKHTAGKSLQFAEGQPSAIYQRLVEGNNRPTISILGLPEPTRRDWIERNGRVGRPEAKEWATQNGISTTYDLTESGDGSVSHNVRALLYADDLAKHCRKLEREATLAIEETGSNMLFLVLGFIEYPDQRDSDRIFSAPIVSVPVALSRRDVSGRQSFFLQYTGEDITDNISLREKFKNDFGIALPQLFDEERSTEEEVDIEKYFSDIRRIIKDQPRFVLKRRVSMALLSFTNMLLVRDLDPKKWPEVSGGHALLDHPIVRQVFEGQGDNDGGGYGVAVEHPVEEGDGAKVQLVYDADSSQHSALVDVLFEHKNVVIEGPPGTGKSQTITNLIASSIAEGKRVLFIAEKLAALDVVRTRLSVAGLSNYVLELHSNKTSKKKVLEDLAHRIDFYPQAPIDLPLKLQRLEESRRQLKEYADLANSVIYNRLGLTLHELMWRAERHRLMLTIGEPTLFQMSVPDAGELSQFELARRMDALGHLGAQFEAIGGFDADSAFWGFEPETIVPGDEDKLRDLFATSTTWAEELASETQAYANLIGGPAVGLVLDTARSQLGILRELHASHDKRHPLHLLAGLFGVDGTGTKSRRALDELAARVSRFQDLASIAAQGVRAEGDVDEDRLAGLRRLARAATALEAKLTTPAEIAEQHALLERERGRLRDSAAVILGFASQRDIAFDGTRVSLDQLSNLTRLVTEAPDSSLHVQGKALLRDGAVQALTELNELQARWAALRDSVGEKLYVDVVPAEDVLNAAILALRQGDAWYRPFQRRWRAAVALHKGQQRLKRKVPTKERLEQLESILLVQQLRRRLNSDVTWQSYLEISPPIELYPLDDYLSVAEWNRSMAAAMEELGTSPFSLEEVTPEKARALRREFASVGTAISVAVASMRSIGEVLSRVTDAGSGATIDAVGRIVDEFNDAVAVQLPWLEMQCPAQSCFGDCLAGCDAALERRSIVAEVESDSELKDLLADQFAGIDTDIVALRAVLEFGGVILGSDLSPPAKRLITSSLPIEAIEELIARLDRIAVELELVDGFVREMSTFGEFDLGLWVGLQPEQDLGEFAVRLHAKLDRAASSTATLMSWSSYVARRNEAGSIGLGAFRARLETRNAAPAELADTYAYCAYATIVREVFRQVPKLGRFSGLKHTQIRDDFKRLDRETIKLRGKAIATAASARAFPPRGHNGTRVDDKTEMFLLHHLLPQQRPRMPVRKMLARAGASIQALKPCFMMSPQAVAQFLSPGRAKFDLVIMDEASQLKPEQAIGAIARGGQLVVVGDPKQLPPTSFFTRGGQAADDDEEYSTTDAESILDVCSGHFRPTRALKWHYRSQHHSLIAFSNANYYKNLIIFPSPYGQSANLGVRATYLADAVYDNQTNLKEAQRVVDAVVEHVQSRPTESLGVVTLNIKQRDLIAELLDERLNNTTGADEYRQHWREKEHPLFVRNLENVQGDERDAIIISTTFGKPPGAGAVRQNFGPISRQGGWRRLNVLFTRAKRSVAVFTSLRPDDIVVDGSTPEGTKSLRNYLEYARTGQLTVSAETGAEPDSDFEVAVMDVLRGKGYEVTPQLGVAGYRIDIAVKHPDAPGTYLAAIECDGASYHSAQSVRDRDRIRQEILESLGWRDRIWRIWSTDWFRTPRQETEKLISFLENVRTHWKPEYASGASWVEEGTASAIRPTAEAIHEENRRTVSEVLLAADGEVESEIGDIVKFVDINNETDVMTLRIVRAASDLENGLLSAAAPLAQTLLGAVVGDEVSLHVPGSPARLYRVLDIKRPI